LYATIKAMIILNNFTDSYKK